MDIGDYRSKHQRYLKTKKKSKGIHATNLRSFVHFITKKEIRIIENEMFG